MSAKARHFSKAVVEIYQGKYKQTLLLFFPPQCMNKLIYINLLLHDECNIDLIQVD